MLVPRYLVATPSPPPRSSQIIWRWISRPPAAIQLLNMRASVNLVFVPGTSFNGRTARSQCADGGSIPLVSSRLIHVDLSRFPAWIAAFLRTALAGPILWRDPRNSWFLHAKTPSCAPRHFHPSAHRWYRLPVGSGFLFRPMRIVKEPITTITERRSIITAVGRIPEVAVGALRRFHTNPTTLG